MVRGGCPRLERGSFAVEKWWKEEKKREREGETNGETNGKGRKGREEREKKRIIEEGRRIKEEQGGGGQSTSLDGDLRPRRRA